VVGATYPAAKNPGFLPDYGCAKAEAVVEQAEQDNHTETKQAEQDNRTTEAEKQLAAAGDREHQRLEEDERNDRTETKQAEQDNRTETKQAEQDNHTETKQAEQVRQSMLDYGHSYAKAEAVILKRKSIKKGI